LSIAFYFELKYSFLSFKAKSISFLGVFCVFFLKTIKKNHQIPFIKATKYPVNITFKFYPDFVQSISSFKMFEKFGRQILNASYQFENISDFLP